MAPLPNSGATEHIKKWGSTVTQSDMLEIYNFVVNNYQYDTMELLEKHKALT